MFLPAYHILMKLKELSETVWVNLLLALSLAVALVTFLFDIWK